MGHKRRLTPQQKQIRFLTLFVGTIMVAVVIALMWLINSRPPGTDH
jgi:hypothetical protein